LFHRRFAPVPRALKAGKGRAAAPARAQAATDLRTMSQ